MKIILAQINISENYKHNLLKIINIIEESKFDIMLFPELALTSYNLKKAMKISNKVIKESLKVIQDKINNSQIVVVGTIKREKNSIYNSAAIISKQDINYYHKNTLTKYDSSYFDKSNNILTFNFKKQKIGVLICRDQDNNKLIKKYKKNKCNILLQLSAHYYKADTALKKLDKNIAIPIVRAIDSDTLFCKVNTVGKNKNEISLGSSMIVNSSGCIYRKANMFKEEIMEFDTKEENER